MKNLIKKSFVAILIAYVFCVLPASAQNSRARVGILSFDNHIDGVDAIQLCNITRMEIEKLDTFDVMDRYDAEGVLQREKIAVSNCFSRDCLVGIGKTLQCDYMFTGTGEIFNNRITITVRMIDVKHQNVVKTSVKEFGNYPQQLQSMVQIVIKSMFDHPIDQTMYDQLSKQYDYENSINQPNIRQLSLEGPRMGITVLTGNDAGILQSTGPGGFGLRPTMFQIGYQFEKQYMNSGAFQALFEFVPMITGLDQNQFLPSITLLNGLRNNKSGWEFAIGATVALTKQTTLYKGSDYNYYYYDGTNFYDMVKGEKMPNNVTNSISNESKTQFDSRGDNKLMTAIVLAVGKSFRSGNLNIPVNFWVMPQKDAIRVGLSVGYNSSK